MQVTIQVPDDIAQSLGDGASIERELIEILAAEAYRRQKLSRRQVSDLLGLDYWQTEDFLTTHDAKRSYTLADLEVDRRSLAGSPPK